MQCLNCVILDESNCILYVRNVFRTFRQCSKTQQGSLRCPVDSRLSCSQHGELYVVSCCVACIWAPMWVWITNHENNFEFTKIPKWSSTPRSRILQMILAASRNPLLFLLKKVRNRSRMRRKRKLRSRDACRRTLCLALHNERSLDRHHRDICFVRWDTVSVSINEIVSPSVLRRLSLTTTIWSDQRSSCPLALRKSLALNHRTGSVFFVCTRPFVSSNQFLSCEKMTLYWIDSLTVNSHRLDNEYKWFFIHHERNDADSWRRLSWSSTY